MIKQEKSADRPITTGVFLVYLQHKTTGQATS